ncbi:MAG: DUF975 family protein [Oscillospiraceae bacterium]|nr:DUF975 family protein [Oscillospiraceae bacterium]
MPDLEVPSTFLKAGARSLLRENAPKVFFASLLFVVLVSIITELQFRLPGTQAAYASYIEQISAGTPHSLGLLISFLNPIGTAFVVLLWLFRRIVGFGLMSYCINLVRIRRSSALDILDGFLFLVKIASILLISSALTLLWSALLVIPGVIASYRYRQAYYILLDDPQKSAMQCIRESKSLMRGNKLDLFLIDFSFVGWSLLSASVTLLTLLFSPISLPVASIFVSPYMGLAHAAYYDTILKKVTA